MHLTVGIVKRSSGNKPAFTIIELLVVIVVIAILAAISLVSYAGISSKAISSSLQSDLSNVKQQLALYNVEHGSYPTSLDTNNCPLGSSPSPDTRYCLKPSNGNSFTYFTLGVATSPDGFGLRATNSTNTYTITNNSAPALMSSLATTDPANWLAIGTQVWAKYNLNVGTMVTGATTQTDNSTIEKYCYSDTESNCTTYGGLYQWDEMMQYVTTEGAQGICPTGSHIPSDNDWKILEMHLGMSQAQADIADDWRGTTQGTQLKPGGSSGLDLPLAGYRKDGGLFTNLSSSAYLQSSSQSSDRSAWERYLNSGNATVYRNTFFKTYGLSVRCVGD